MIKTKVLLNGLAKRLSEAPHFREAYFYYKGYIVALHKYDLISTSTLKSAYQILEEAWNRIGDTCIKCNHKVNDYIDGFEGKICPQCFTNRK